MLEIRELTDGYAPPADSCTTYRVCLQELEAFEFDLHAHVHLENNILFPEGVGARSVAELRFQSMQKERGRRRRFTLRAVATAEELLRTTPIFSRLTPADRRTVAEVSRVQQFGKGDLIFEQESPSDAFYAIASGRVKIFKMMPEWEGSDPRGLRTGRSARRRGRLHGSAVPGQRDGARRHDLRDHSAAGVLRAARFEPVARPWPSARH